MRRFLREILEKKFDKEIFDSKVILTYYIIDVQFFSLGYIKEENVKVRLNLEILRVTEQPLNSD